MLVCPNLQTNNKWKMTRLRYSWQWSSGAALQQLLPVRDHKRASRLVAQAHVCVRRQSSCSVIASEKGRRDDAVREGTAGWLADAVINYPSRSEVCSSHGIITCSASGKCSRSAASETSVGKLPRYSRRKSVGPETNVHQTAVVNKSTTEYWVVVVDNGQQPRSTAVSRWRPSWSHDDHSFFTGCKDCHVIEPVPGNHQNNTAQWNRNTTHLQLNVLKQTFKKHFIGDI